jgi:hypothetical protein
LIDIDQLVLEMNFEMILHKFCIFVIISPMKWLTNYLLFYVPLKHFSLYGDVTIASERQQNLGLCSALRAFEQWGGVFIVPHLL